MEYKNVAIIVFIAALISFGIGAKVASKVTTETKVVEVEKEVIKRDVVTQIKVITRPDGTKEESTTITDKTTEDKSSSKQSESKTAPNWHVSAGTKASVNNLNELSYTLNVDRRILGNLFVGASVSTDKQVGLSIGMEF